MTQPTRQRLGRSEAREIILEAAARVFNQKGRAVTVEDIAHEAGYSTSALYKHFANKDDILHTLWIQVGERMRDLFQTEPPVALSFIKRLKWLLYRMARMAEETREFYIAGMANTPIALPATQLEDTHLDNYLAIRDSMVALMQRGIDEGVLKPGDPELYAMALGGHLQSLTMNWALYGPYPLMPRIDQALEIFLFGTASPSMHAASLAESPLP